MTLGIEDGLHSTYLGFLCALLDVAALDHAIGFETAILVDRGFEIDIGAVAWAERERHRSQRCLRACWVSGPLELSLGHGEIRFLRDSGSSSIDRYDAMLMRVRLGLLFAASR